MSTTEQNLALEKARTIRREIEERFFNLAAQARIAPLDMQLFVEHRKEMLAAEADLYKKMWASIADTGVRIIPV
jgi:hypothetical protein